MGQMYVCADASVCGAGLCPMDGCRWWWVLSAASCLLLERGLPWLLVGRK